MKKFIVFIFSFVLLFFTFQLLSGLFLTLTYVPDIGESWESVTYLTQNIVIESGNSFLPILLFAGIALIIAVYISTRRKKNT